MTLLSTVDDLIDELRSIGVPVSASEKIDAASALRHTDLGDRTEFKNGLAVTLIKTASHQMAFDTLFDLFFARGTRPSDLDEELTADGVQPAQGPRPASGLDALDDNALRALITDCIESPETAALLQAELVRVAVSRWAGIVPGRAVAGTFYLYRVVREINMPRVADTVTARWVARDPQITSDPRRARLLNEEIQNALDGLRRDLEYEIRRQLVADRGAGAVAKTLRHPLPEDEDFLTSAGAHIDEVRAAIEPLARKLAAQLSRRRRAGRRGPLSIRKTIRASLSYGGVPVLPVYDAPHPRKPELFVLADISGSVSAFAAYTLQLTYALRTEFSRLRSFVFIDGLDEVTHLFATAEHASDVSAEINKQGLGVWLDGHSDYGNALHTFWHDHGASLGPRSTVIILGDARLNYHSPRTDILEAIHNRCGHLIWLNPERKVSWNTGDSEIGRYERYCDQVAECRNVRQLKAFIGSLV